MSFIYSWLYGTPEKEVTPFILTNNDLVSQRSMLKSVDTENPLRFKIYKKKLQERKCTLRPAISESMILGKKNSLKKTTTAATRIVFEQSPLLVQIKSFDSKILNPIPKYSTFAMQIQRMSRQLRTAPINKDRFSLPPPIQNENVYTDVQRCMSM